MVTAIPRQRLPTVMAGFKSDDKHLAFRVKRLFAENRNFTARGQSNRKVCASFFCIHIEDIQTFAINLMRTKVPWAMGSLSYHGNVNCAFDYQHD